MAMPVLRNAKRDVSTATILAVLLGLGFTANADNKKPAPQAPAKPAAPTPKLPAPAARPAGNPSGGATHRPNTSEPSANHPASTGPSANHPSLPNKPNVGDWEQPKIHPSGSSERSTPNGDVVRIRADGRLRDLHDPKRGLDVHHGLNGSRRISVERPGPPYDTDEHFGHGRIITHEHEAPQ